MWTSDVLSRARSQDPLVDRPLFNGGHVGAAVGVGEPIATVPVAKERIVFTFHGIGEAPSGTANDELPYWIPKALFRDAVKLFSQDAFERDVVLTFDDGFKSDLLAAEELTRAGIAGHFFVVAGRLGVPGYLTPRDTRQIAQSGFEVGLHGYSHVNWRRLKPSEWQLELVDARSMIAGATGRPVRSVALPFGAYDRRVLKQLAKHQFDRIYTSDPGPSAADAVLVRRTTVTSNFSLQTFVNIIEDRVALFKRARRKVAPLIKSWR